MAEVAAMADGDAVDRYAIDDIGASLLPVDLVMEGRDSEYLEPSFPEAARPVYAGEIGAEDRAGIVVIGMMVADGHDVGLDAGDLVAHAPAEGIHEEPRPRARGQQEARLPEPSDLHIGLTPS